MNRTRIAGAITAAALLVPAGIVASAPAAHANPKGAYATASVTVYPNTPLGRFCAKHPYLRPLC